MNWMCRALSLTALVVFVVGCSNGSKGDRAKEKEAAMVQLGQMLYFDGRLSKDDSISCNTCHDVSNKGPGADNLPTSVGIGKQKGGRNAPTVWNARFLSVQFWDGRAPNLVEQAKGPITNPIEMGMDDHDIAVGKIRQIDGYRPYFKKAFGEATDEAINIENIATAIAEFEKTLVALNSPYDKYKAGDLSALTDTEISGMQLFNTTGCIACHSGDYFAGPPLPEGTGFYQKFPMFPGSKYDKKYALLKDKGRFDVTKKEEDKNFWRVPTLRNVARTAPYFHNGSVKTLDEAVRVMAKAQLNRTLSAQEVTQIVAFLNALNGELPQIEAPTLPQ